MSGNVLVRPPAAGVKQEPPLPVSVELARGESRRRARDTIRERIRAVLVVQTGRARSVGHPRAERVQVEAWSSAEAPATTVVGSYPQPDWLIDRERLGERLPRVRALELWLVPEPWLEQAQDDATRLAVAGHGAAGVETSPTARCGARATRTASRRRSTASTSTTPASRSTARATRTPSRASSARSAGRARWRCADVEFLRRITERRIKITVPGPFTMTQQAQDDHYGDERSLALAYAEAVNEELRDLKAGRGRRPDRRAVPPGAPEPARAYALEAIDRALDGVEGETVLHTCFGYAHIVERLTGYPFLRELNGCAATTSRSRRRSRPRPGGLDGSVADKTIILGVLDLGHGGGDAGASPTASAGALDVAAGAPRPSLPTAG